MDTIRSCLHTLALLIVLPLFILLIPVLLPVALAYDAAHDRRRARTLCANCGAQIGLAEVRRAKLEAKSESRRWIDAVISRGGRPRVVSVWRIKCPVCGTEYRYTSDRRDEGLTQVATDGERDSE